MLRLFRGGSELPVQWPQFRKKPVLGVLIARGIAGGPSVVEKFAAGAVLAALPEIREKGYGGEMLIAIGWVESRPELQLVVAALGQRQAVARFASVAAGDVLTAPSSTIPGEMPVPTLFVDGDGRVAIDAGGPLGGTGALLRMCGVDVWEFTPTTFRMEVLRDFAREDSPGSIRASLPGRPSRRLSHGGAPDDEAPVRGTRRLVHETRDLDVGGSNEAQAEADVPIEGTIRQASGHGFRTLCGRRGCYGSWPLPVDHREATRRGVGVHAQPSHRWQALHVWHESRHHRHLGRGASPVKRTRIERAFQGRSHPTARIRIVKGALNADEAKDQDQATKDRGQAPARRSKAVRKAQRPRSKGKVRR